MAITGLVWIIRKDRAALVWLGMALIFWLLSLGVVWRFNINELPFRWTPYFFLQNNPLFEAMRNPHRFSLAMILPWSVLVGYGAAALWTWLGERRSLAWALSVGLGVLLLSEISVAPIPQRALNISPFYQSAGQEVIHSGAIIDLPMGRQPAKVYMFLQTVHGRPIVEGMSARTPPGSYDSINANPLLAAWSRYDPPPCEADIPAAVAQLEADGFTTLILHGEYVPWWGAREPIWATFNNMDPLYEDEWIQVYRLADLAENPPCAAP
ncbi:MAG: hypothetical protein GYB68_12330 [Chloroflexi bacterium]|nr:hypothetical protein [Chloroflexota bacterium]